MVRLLFFSVCIALFTAPQTLEAQLFRRQSRRPAVQPYQQQYRPQPQYQAQPQQPRFTQPQQRFTQPPQYSQQPATPTQQPLTPVQPGQRRLLPRLSNSLIQQPAGQASAIPSTASQPAKAIEIQGQFDPVIQTSSESLDLSSQVRTIADGGQPRTAIQGGSVVAAAPSLMPMEIREKPIVPVEAHSILQIISE